MMRGDQPLKEVGIFPSLPSTTLWGGSKRITSKGWGRLQEEGLVTHSSTGHSLPSSRSFHRNVLQLLVENPSLFLYLLPL